MLRVAKDRLEIVVEANPHQQQLPASRLVLFGAHIHKI
jgi:hypothetical protein